MKPLVSVITPTTLDRRDFNNRLNKLFHAQDYKNKEITFGYCRGNVGEKRNKLCRQSSGSIIIHMDSDDWYAPDWISKSVEFLLSSNCDMVGLSVANFHNPTLNKTWQYSYPIGENLIGATLCYHRSYWEQKQFQPLQEGEDNNFIRGSNFKAHDYTSGFIATLHEGQTSAKNISGERWVEV